ncbi:MAG: ECF-type riboflavin transporter substrate-binding protein [Sphaerochaetaceae bacterium]|nr:ECF-type riboflavin transporter substrate-binding protein [Sphaerochaetaceae bacterium]
MDQQKSMKFVQMVVVVAIGAALYGLGGLIGIPIFANTTIKPAMAILALFAGVYGPVVGFLVGFLGHWITDLFAGWGVWFTWVLGSGIVGIVIGLYPMFTAHKLDEGIFGGKQAGIFILLSFLGNFVGYCISALLDYFLFAEPLNKVVTQQLLIAFVNTVVIAILGSLLMALIARRNRNNTNLTLDENVEQK